MPNGRSKTPFHLRQPVLWLVQTIGWLFALVLIPLTVTASRIKGEIRSYSKSSLARLFRATKLQRPAFSRFSGDLSIRAFERAPGGNPSVP